VPLYLGLDAGPHKLAGVVVEIDPHQRRIVFQHAVAADDGDALDRLLGMLAESAQIDIDDLRAIAATAHGDAAGGGDLQGRLAAPGGEELSAHWQRRYSFRPTPIAAWPDTDTARRIGSGVVTPGTLLVSLGTNDTVSAEGMPALRFRNGSLAREWIRFEHRLDWNAFAYLLEQTPGNGGYVMLPWLETEITPRVERAGLRRFGFDAFDAGLNVRGLVEGQMMAMANHAAGAGAGPIDRVIVIGAEAANRAVLQVMSNVFAADVHRLDAEHPAALGAALGAFYADRRAAGEPVTWQTAVSGFTEPNPGHRVSPNPRLAAMYAELRREYAILERLHKDRAPIC
jgi:hypothetical protein